MSDEHRYPRNDATPVGTLSAVERELRYLLNHASNPNPDNDETVTITVDGYAYWNARQALEGASRRSEDNGSGGQQR